MGLNCLSYVECLGLLITEIYSGQENDPSNRKEGEPDVGANGNVIRLTRAVPHNVHHKLYHDNYHTCLPLMVYLETNGIHSLGTV